MNFWPCLCVNVFVLSVYFGAHAAPVHENVSSNYLAGTQSMLVVALKDYRDHCFINDSRP